MKKILLIALFAALLLIPIGLLAQYEIAVAPSQPYPAPSKELLSKSSAVPEETPISPEMRQILEYQELLKKDNLNAEMQETLLNKINMLSLVVTQRAVIKETQIITPFNTPGYHEDSQLPTGLQEGRTSTFHSWEAQIHNFWSGFSEDEKEHFTVYAGELGSGWKEQAGRGVIYVQRINATSRQGTFEQYLMPEGTGWVRISEVKGDYIILTSEEGNTFYFYIPGQQFVDSLDEVTITVTPMPTPTQRTNTLGPPPSPPPLPTPDPSQPYP